MLGLCAQAKQITGCEVLVGTAHGAERTWNMPFTIYSISHITSLVTSSLRDVRAGYFYLYKLLLAITKRYY